MNLRTPLVILAVAAGLVCAAPASAGRLFLDAHGGWSTLNMDDANDAVDAANREVGEPILDHVVSGWDAGLRVGWDLNEELALGLGYARLWANSEFSRNDYSVSLDLPADLFELSLDYVPASDRTVRFGAGTMVGMIRSAATFRESSGGAVLRDDAFEGAGFLFAAYGIAETGISPRWFLFAQAGLRHAVINELKVDGEVILNPDSLDDKVRFNYGGLFLRLGIRFRP